jgi:hypothetical protein
VNFTYDGSADAPTDAGSYTVIGTISDDNYIPASATDSLVISQGIATVTLGNLSQTYDGSAKSASATTAPAGLTVNLTYNGSATPPTNVGIYSVIGTISDVNYLGSGTNTMRVTFSTNRFLAAAGNYVGLFCEAGGVTFSNAGYFKATVVARSNKLATASGTLRLEDNSVGYSKVTFDMFGNGTSAPVNRSRWGKPSLTVRLHLPLDGSDTISGTVSNNAGDWVSDITGYRAVPVSNYAGLYTMAVLGTPSNYLTEPGGHGYGLVQISSKGVVKLSGGVLANGTVWGQTTQISPDGQWPLFSYQAYPKIWNRRSGSVILGWLTVSSNGISGTPSWIKLSGTTRVYPDEFAFEPEVIGSPYSTSAEMLLPGWNGVASWIGGGLTNDIDRNVTLSGDGRQFTFANGTNRPQLKLTPATGRLTFSIKPGEFASKSTLGSGVVLVNRTNGFGYFRSLTSTGGKTNYTGAFELTP